MKKSRVWAFVLTMALGLSSCGVEKVQVPEGYETLFTNGSFDDNSVWTCDDEKYSDLISGLLKECDGTFEGSVMVATDDQVIFTGGWNALETDGKTVVNPFTTYEIGSLTKQFMAACILQQVQAGNIRTDETIDKYFPEYPYGSQITVDHLLHMDSGIVDYVNNPYVFFKGNVENAKEIMQSGQLTDEDILYYLNRTKLTFEPGKRFSYSNTAYFLLALILEQVTGQTYEEYMQKNIFDVCKMQNSTTTEIGNITSVPAPEAGYMQDARTSRGVGDIHSNVCDILLWDRALMAGEVINSEQLQYMTQMRAGYSCGWMDNGDGNIYHGGSTLGYVCVNKVFRVEDIGNVYVIAMTTNPDEAYIFELIFNVIKENT